MVPVLALAAFLAVGSLPGSSDVPTVEAQGFTPPGTNLDAKKCEADAEGTASIAGGPCTTDETSLEVALFVDGADDVNRRVYVTGGDDYAKVQASSASESGSPDNDVEVTAENAIGEKGVDRHTLRFDEDAFSEKRYENIMVSSSMADDRGRVYVFVYTPDEDASNGNLSADSISLDGDAAFGILVQFVSAPVVGADGGDRNEIIENFQQCVLNEDDPDDQFDSGTTNADGDTITCSPSGGGTDLDVVDEDDKPEIRSKLVAHSLVGTGVTDPKDAFTTHVLDGSSEDHLLGPGQNSVVIYATVMDQGQNDLVGTEVTFAATSNPAGVFTSTRSVDALEVTDSTPGDNQVANPDIEDVESDNPFDNIDADMALASRTISNLPDSGFRITVVVTAGDVEIGTIVVARQGAPSHIMGAAFSMGCLVDMQATPTDGDITDDTFDADADDCEMQSRFGDENYVVIKAHLEDNLNTVIDGTLSASLDGDDKALAEIETDDEDPPAMAWIYKVDTDAKKDPTSLGAHMVTISHPASEDDDDINVADHMINFDVAGPPSIYAVAGEDVIALRGAEMYMVTATDSEGGVPHFTKDADGNYTNDKVEIFIQDLPSGNARGLDSSSMLELVTETGEGTFTIFAPRDAMHGDVIRIFVGDETTASKTVMFGGNRAPMAEGSIDDQMVYVGATVMVDVSGYFSDADMDTLTYTAESDMMDYATASVDGSMVT
jgi:hypothetical protein